MYKKIILFLAVLLLSACGLSDGKSIYESVLSAKEYITGALKTSFDVGKGSGPLLHNYKIV